MKSRIDIVIAGQLRREYILPPSGAPLIDVPGGNLLYAAASARLWQEHVGLLARIGENYPQEWLRRFSDRGLDPRGIRILPEAMDLRAFYAYADSIIPQRTSPVSHFARLGLAFPKSLLGYQAPEEKQDSRMQARADSPRLLDIPKEFYEAKAVHLCALDYVTHTQLAPEFRHAKAVSITIDPSPGYMNPMFIEQVRSLVQGVTAFIPSEEELRALFWGRSNDIWAMIEELGKAGVECVVVKRASLGQLVYDAGNKKRWEIPAYPARVVDPTGAGNAFCGGFSAGYLLTYDPLRAALYGNVSASLAVEGSGAFYALDSLPGLAQARLQSIAGLVRQI